MFYGSLCKALEKADLSRDRKIRLMYGTVIGLREREVLYSKKNAPSTVSENRCVGLQPRRIPGVRSSRLDDS